MDPGKKTDKSTKEKDSLKSVKLDPPSKPLKTDLPSNPTETNTIGSREGSPSDATSCISSGDATTYCIKESEVDQASMADQGMHYYGYYPGFSGSFGAWDEQSYSGFADHLEIQPSVIQSDNGPVYYLPGYQAGYVPYNPVLPGAMISVDGQYLGQPSYYPNAAFQQPLASPGFRPQSVPCGSEMVPAYPWDSSLLFANVFQGNGYGGDLTNTTTKSNFSSRSCTLASSKSSKSASADSKGSSLVSDVAPSPKQPPKPVNKGSLPVFSKAYLPKNNVSSFTYHGKGGLLHPNSHSNVKEYGRNWVGGEKVKTRNKLQGFGDFDLQIKQYHGPRTNNTKSSLNSAVDLVGSIDVGKNDNASTPFATVNKNIYNLPEFSTKYDQALFFVIKSYSEDDIHKSIKYNVWASTPNGNKRLDSAFQIAQDKMVEKGSSCPVFLFFSVNASGQFCGVAEMLDRVDFAKNMDFWQHDKWNGFFPVKWHIIKDIPNPLFRHIILENNENKPVTNSRDTQEVNFLQGIQMLNIFKSYSSKTSVLDDFDFYENRQKAMQHKRSNPPAPKFGHQEPKTDKFAEVIKPGDLKSMVASLQSAELEEAVVAAKDSQVKSGGQCSTGDRGTS